jgi:hypothetical protein
MKSFDKSTGVCYTFESDPFAAKRRESLGSIGEHIRKPLSVSSFQPARRHTLRILKSSLAS